MARPALGVPLTDILFRRSSRALRLFVVTHRVAGYMGIDRARSPPAAPAQTDRSRRMGRPVSCLPRSMSSDWKPNPDLKPVSPSRARTGRRARSMGPDLARGTPVRLGSTHRSDPPFPPTAHPPRSQAKSEAGVPRQPTRQPADRPTDRQTHTRHVIHIHHLSIDDALRQVQLGVRAGAGGGRRLRVWQGLHRARAEPPARQPDAALLPPRCVAWCSLLGSLNGLAPPLMTWVPPFLKIRIPLCLATQPQSPPRRSAASRR